MKHISFCLFLVLICVACATEEEAAPAAVADPADVVQVRSIVVTDSIGIELGDADYVFGSIEAVDHTLSGNILVLDRAACSVVEYTPDGEFVQRMGRSGSGPGEFLNPLSMTRLSDERIAIMDINNGGFFTYSPEGISEGKTPIQYNEPILFLTPSIENSFIGTHNSWDMVDGELLITAVVGRYSLDSDEPVEVYWENSFTWDFQDITPLIQDAYFAQTWTSDRDGHVFLAPRSSEDYVISGFTAEGAPSVTIEFDIEQVRKTEEEIAEEAFFWNKRAESMGANGPFNYQPCEYRWMVHSMGIDAEDRLWVRRGTEEIPTFDVFSLDGNYLFKVEFAGVGGPRGLFWEIRVDKFGILAYSLDPEDGYQKLYTLELE